MNSIAIGSLINVFEFVPIEDIMGLRDVCQHFREVLDESSRPHWEKMREENLFPNICEKKLICKNSIGSTALIIKASTATCRCIQCFCYITRTHEFYGVRLCKSCKNLPLFVQRGLKSTCQEFFLKSTEQVNNPRLLKRKHGNSFMVLEHHVFQEALNNYSVEVLHKKLDARKRRRQLILNHRREAVNQRINIVKRDFDVKSRQKSIRIDARLGGKVNLDRVYDILINNSLYEMVCGDVFSNKVGCYRSPKVVSENLIDFVCMLTYMRKVNILDDSYSEFGEEPLVKYIFKRHQKGLHFYEYVSEYAASISEYECRVREVQTFIDSTGMNEEDRKLLSVSMCAEDNIHYNESDFEFFIKYGEGNPAKISRAVRERVFLDANEFMIHVSTNIQMGYSYLESMQRARNRVLNRTLGFPPMRYVCRINFRRRSPSVHCDRFEQPVSIAAHSSPS